MNLFLILLALSASLQAISITTWGYDQANSHANTSENVLNWNTVNSHFGKRCSYTAAGAIWAQTLFMDTTPVAGHNEVAFIATMNDTIEAFDPNNCKQLWSASLTANSGTDAPWTNYSQLQPHILYDGPLGCLSTPVIDTSAGVIWALCASGGSGTTGIWKLYSRNISDGSQFHAPITISGTVNSTSFDPSKQLGRAALTLANGNVYMAWASGVVESNPGTIWKDFIMAYSTSTFAQVGIYCGACSAGSQYNDCVWMSGAKMAVDGSGNIYVMTANPSTNAGDGYTSVNLTDSFLKFNSSLTLQAHYSPITTDTTDVDLGSTGPILIGNSYVIGSGKTEVLYVLNQSDLSLVQNFNLANNGGSGLPGGINGSRSDMYADGAYFPSLAYDNVYKYSFGGSSFTTTPAATSSIGPLSPGFSFPGASVAYSSNNGASGSQIVWAMYPSADSTLATSTAVLVALKGTDLSKIWDSCTTSCSTGPDAVGNFVKFAPPTVANGKVMVGTNSSVVDVFGIPANFLSGAATLSGTTNMK